MGSSDPEDPSASFVFEQAVRKKMPTKVKVGRIEDFPAGQVRVVDADGERVAVANVDGQLYAFEDRCSHDDAPLGEGELEGCQVECPRHGARFDVRTGAALCMPAVVPIATYPVQVTDGAVAVELDF